MDDLRALASLITLSVTEIEERCSAIGTTFPSLDEPLNPTNAAVHADSSISLAVSNIVAAAAQLTAIARPPQLSIMTSAMKYHTPAALRVVVGSNVPEILREGGREGLHVREIAKQSKTDPNKLARLLRLLSTEHIFKELSPDVFANNRLSSVMDTGKNSRDLFATPSEKYTGTDGIAAFILHCTRDAFKSSAFLGDIFLDPKFTLSEEPNRAAFNIAFQTDLTFFGWLKEQRNETVRKELGRAMAGVKSMLPPNQVLSGFDWSTLPDQSVVVDVGGGVGSETLEVAKAFPNLKIVVEDVDATIREARSFWGLHLPNAEKSGQVTFQPIDFFVEQPIKAASVFFLQSVLHDWADSYCHKILTILREAAAPQTKLLIVDSIISYACNDITPVSGVPGGSTMTPPTPLLPNYGMANILSYMSDLQMMTIANGQERTLAHLGQLLRQSGWEIAKVYRTHDIAAHRQQILAVPIFDF